MADEQQRGETMLNGLCDQLIGLMERAAGYTDTHYQSVRDIQRSILSALRAPASPAPAKESATQVPVSASLGDDDEAANGNRPVNPERKLAATLDGTTPVFADPEQPSAALADDATQSATWLRKLASGYDPVGPEYENAARLLDQFAASLRSVEPAPRGEQMANTAKFAGDQGWIDRTRLDAAAQDIRDLFARYGSGDYVPTENEKQIIDLTLDNVLIDLLEAEFGLLPKRQRARIAREGKAT